jgi:hypothetical protein
MAGRVARGVRGAGAGDNAIPGAVHDAGAGGADAAQPGGAGAVDLGDRRRTKEADGARGRIQATRSGAAPGVDEPDGDRGALRREGAVGGDAGT